MDKQALRERVWDSLEESGEARFPFPPHGRIPNYKGAEDAAELLAGTPEWMEADAVKCNPDSPQRPVRLKALQEGKTVYVAVPRLRDEECFLRLDPTKIAELDHATTIKGSSEMGAAVTPDGIDSIDLIVAGSVAVTPEGARVGKGEGYSDLEYAVLQEYDVIEDPPVATTVHELQLVEEDVGVESHDVPLDLVVTPERVVRTETSYGKPRGIDWGRLSEERVEEIPVLGRLSRNH